VSGAFRLRVCVASREIRQEFFGADVRASPDMARIVNARHFKRVTELVDKSKGKVRTQIYE
jgi:hypothetical protein